MKIKEIFPVLDIDKSVIETFSEIKSWTRKTGDGVDDMDLLIAATALTMNLTLITNNEKHFLKIRGLKIDNWTK